MESQKSNIEMINKMKHIAIFIAFLMLSAISYAQKLTVESFKLVSENAAATENVVKDINDTPCAILRIKTTEKGLKLGGNVVGTALTNGKEYIANVATGTKKITIVGKETYPLTVYFSEYGINSLKSNASYEMILKTSVISTEVTGEIGGHEYVDLGLSVKWATYNIGASCIEEKGNLYKYGETVPYDEDRPYTFMNENAYGYEIKKIPIKNDVAHVRWGGSWRMPTTHECQELFDNCKHIWTIRNGIHGVLFIAKNGNKLFLPATEWDDGEEGTLRLLYWSNHGEGIQNMKLTLRSITGMSSSFGRIFPNMGLYVRAVSDLPKEPEIWQYDFSKKPDGYNNGYGFVDLGLSVKWATSNIGAKKNSDMGVRYCWGESTAFDEQLEETDMWNKGLYKYGMTKNRFGNWGYESSYDKKYGVNGNSRLLADDDIAHIERKSNWRIPTKSEMEELLTKCTWVWTYDYNSQGIYGFIVTSNVEGYTDKAIFIPCDPDCNPEYWSSDRSKKRDKENNIDTGDAYTICLNGFNYHISEQGRTSPLYIRPVCNK